MKKSKISFCTVSMNRLHHLRQTILKNIEDNIHYFDLEFLLLDYNSNDGLEEWVKSNLKEYINHGILNFYRTNDPNSFHRSHSRNIAFKLAKGDIICNLDADNFLGKDFAHYLNYQFSYNDKIFVTSGKRDGSYGRVCLKKLDFFKVRGYDEKMSGWGFEDEDLYKRLLNLGLKRIQFSHNYFTRSIEHENKDNTSNDYVVSQVIDIYVYQKTPLNSMVLYILKDNNFKHGVVSKDGEYGEINLEGTWREGSILNTKNQMILKFKDKTELCLRMSSDDSLTNKNIKYRMLKDNILRSKVLKMLTGLENKNRFKNRKLGATVTNFGEWGSASLRRNFSFDMKL